MRECLAFLDADDRWTEGSLEARMDAFRADEGLGLVYGRVREFSAHPGAALRPETAAPIPSAVVIRRDAFERCGRFAARFAGADAVEWYARVVDAGIRVRAVDVVVCERRVPAGYMARPGRRCT